MSEKGMTSSMTAKATIAALWRRAGRNTSRWIAIGTSTSAASANRLQATAAGDSSASASLMKKYGTPHKTHSTENVIQARQLTRNHRDGGRKGRELSHDAQREQERRLCAHVIL